ncbi:MAG TPA: prolyl-tRNA synthetase associated domain-containing protein [Lachnospiraceae bacterium]|uniref:prolyl-tRNA synthetase associated domain-containing protein n=1 Tax=Anaerosporobacter sp. TaxID=1872529 RepID=UPI000EBE9158|nr:prolyl-tRNA synthetase associated domain-containing protein [Anaerosporobacter sp.]HAB61259.1 prolyl-tRNA synthetase associated domain-containing protein [Lachnospiraceae bacterium]
MYELEKGRPSNEEGRLAKEIRVYDLLDRLHIEYERVDHEEANTIEACKDIDVVLGVETSICKNLFLCNSQKTKFYLLMLPGNKVFKTKDLSKQIGSSRLSFASQEYMEKYLDITPGSVSVMGLMNDSDNQVQLLIDREVMEPEFFACHPCINTSSIKLRCIDILEVFLPDVHHEPIFVEL